MPIYLTLIPYTLRTRSDYPIAKHLASNTHLVSQHDETWNSTLLSLKGGDEFIRCFCFRTLHSFCHVVEAFGSSQDTIFRTWARDVLATRHSIVFSQHAEAFKTIEAFMLRVSDPWQLNQITAHPVHQDSCDIKVRNVEGLPEREEEDNEMKSQTLGSRPCTYFYRSRKQREFPRNYTLAYQHLSHAFSLSIHKPITVPLC